MLLSEFKNHLTGLDKLHFRLKEGSAVPRHSHVTEIGVKTTSSMDCGGNIHHHKVLTMQLWSSIDLHHRLKPSKLLSILNQMESTFGIADVEVEVEYETNTLGLYDVERIDHELILVPKHSACKALQTNCSPNNAATIINQKKASLKCC